MLTTLDRLAEDAFIVAGIVPKLELGDVEWEVLRADLVERADNAALEDAPEAFNRVGMDPPMTYWPLPWSTTPCGNSLSNGALVK